MTKHWLILMIVLGTVLPAVAQMPSAPATSSAATNPPPAKSEAAVPSFGRDVGSVLHAVRSRLLSGWQRIAQAVDAFLQPPPASPVVEPLPTPPPAPGPPVAEPPPASVQVAQATPPAQSQPEPQPAPPPAPPAVVQTPAPAPPPAAPAAPPPTPTTSTSATVPAPPPAPPAPEPAAPTPPAPPAQTATQPQTPPVVPAPAEMTATQILIHPIKTSTGRTKFLLVRSVLPTPPPLAEAATHKAPVAIEVQRVVKKKDAADATPVAWGPGYSSYREAASLRIALKNLSPRSLTNVVVRWAVAKIPVGRNPMSREVFLGTNETVALKPMEEKVLETTPVEVGGTKSTLIGRSSGEMIRGHGVQVLLGTNLIFEELVPPQIKIPFTNLQAVPKPTQ